MAVTHWLTRSLSDVPPEDGWLSEEERGTLAGLVVPKRREDFRLGRWTARCALDAAWQRLGGPRSAAAWSVRPRPDGSPEALLGGRSAPLTLSLSHSAGRAMAAVAPASVAMGCDLEAIVPRAPALAEQFFTDDERRAIAAAPEPERALLVTVVWSAKESALKALRAGLRADTRRVQVTLTEGPEEGGFAPLRVAVERGAVADLDQGGGRAARERLLRGCFRVMGSHVLSLVADPWRPLMAE